MSQHVTYRKFTQEEEAARFIELLQAEGIDYSIDDNHRNLDETLYGEQPLPLILVKVAPENFNRLNSYSAKSTVSSEITLMLKC